MLKKLFKDLIVNYFFIINFQENIMKLKYNKIIKNKRYFIINKDRNIKLLRKV